MGKSFHVQSFESTWQDHRVSWDRCPCLHEKNIWAIHLDDAAYTGGGVTVPKIQV